MSLGVRLAALAAVPCLIACATGGSFTETRFPSAALLEEIARSPPPPAEAVEPPRIVASWQLSGPFPNQFADYLAPAASPTATLLGQMAAARASESMTCAARELGAFHLKHGDARPEPLLLQFILGRCGSTESTVASWWLSWDEVRVDDATLLQDARASLAKAVADIDGERLGLALVREGTKAVLVLAAGTPQARVEGSQLATDGKLRIEGTLASRKSGRALIYADALVTVGAWAVAHCERDATVVLPRFAFTCPVDPPSDAPAPPTSIAVMVLEEGRLLTQVAATLLALPEPDSARRFARFEAEDSDSLPALDALPAALLARVNALRTSQGLPPLSAAAGQEREAARLAPRYFAAWKQQPGGAEVRDELADVIALGLLAGWRVEETIGDGDFASVVVYGERLSDLIAGLLGAPIARAALMDPAAEIAALGAAPTAGGLGVVVSTYQRLRPPPTDAATRAFESLRAARAARRVSDLMILPLKGVELEAAQRVQQAKELPWDALGHALRAAVDKRGNELQGWLLEAQSLDTVVWPDALLTAQPTSVAIGVASYKHPHAAWGNLAVLVIAEVDKVQVALAEPPADRSRLESPETLPAAPPCSPEAAPPAGGTRGRFWSASAWGRAQETVPGDMTRRWQP